MTVPNLVEPLKENISRSLQVPAKIDAEIYHMMDKRDEALIADEILHGVTSGLFVYDFDIAGTKVSGISVKGAQHLAGYYGGLKHRIVASTEKRGKLFTFKSYPSEGVPMQVACSIVPELESEPDFYEAVVELTDIKTGNSVQISRSEKRFETRKNGTSYERPNYTVIAESKARRNAILALVPQDVQEKFKSMCQKQGKTMTISVIDEKRDAVMKFAAAKAITMSREQVHNLDWNLISGLSEAAKESIEAFRKSAESLGLISASLEDQTSESKTTKRATKKPDPQTFDPATGEILTPAPTATPTAAPTQAPTQPPAEQKKPAPAAAAEQPQPRKPAPEFQF